MDFKNKHGTCLIIIEYPLNGFVFCYDDDLKMIYEHGSTNGYCKKVFDTRIMTCYIISGYLLSSIITRPPMKESG